MCNYTLGATTSKVTGAKYWPGDWASDVRKPNRILAVAVLMPDVELVATVLAPTPPVVGIAFQYAPLVVGHVLPPLMVQLPATPAPDTARRHAPNMFAPVDQSNEEVA